MKQVELLAQLQLSGVDMSVPALSLLEGQKRPVSDRELCALADALQTYLADTPYPDEAALTEMDDRFISENLSPGGSADLLALTYLLHFFRSEVIEDV